MGGACNFASSPQLLLRFYIICSITFISFGFTASASAKLHVQEVRVLREIAKKLGKRDWDFNKDPCSGQGNWSLLDERKGFENSVICDCSFNNNSSCHLVSIALKSQNLSGIIPPEFSKDLSRNIFTGVIPPQWGTLRLEELSVMGNRLSGPFPKFITNMTTLRNLSIEGNHFTGPIPPEIGKLINLQKLIFSSNALTGKLPAELGNQAKSDFLAFFMPSSLDMPRLGDLPATDVQSASITTGNIADSDAKRINDNNFSGKLPTFIGKWTKVKKLHIQGTSLEGPIPSSIGSLTKLSDLRISDLTGRGSPFPPLSDMESMKTLILRNCLLFGEIPEYIGELEKLKHLDVSFNNLRGEIPSTFIQRARIDFLYLTGNKLTGSVPPWLLERNKNADLSFNNFTWQSSSPDECSRGSVNIVESFSPSTITSRKAHSCLKQNFPCPASRNQQHYSLHINCGGNEITVDDNTTYQDDKEPRGASMFYSHPSQKWAFSSTGNFMDDDSEADAYIKTNDDSNFSAYTDFKPPSNGSKRNVAIIVTGAVAGAIVLTLLVLGVMWRNGWLGGKAAADKGIDISLGLLRKGSKT
ncbi:LEUCINE-RICH REPEAT TRANSMEMBRANE PROTEIN KINASE-RELATED [Salix koriyanagi]|uniref:LEUCINE-RICH REPEAT TRANSMEMBRANE PROTEIN KINASE-RELATED n=1 Tax=Salix koriyanagi TaxID=2511006 RepID=A0A9Q0UZ73_9ROSI|nr:LEUCINE-RICH REPEAT TRANSMEMBRANE PROTEIN KINASE-RELATED [Salix koriyanagi]